VPGDKGELLARGQDHSLALFVTVHGGNNNLELSSGRVAPDGSAENLRGERGRVIHGAMDKLA
jgi:hypothetical protein